MALLGATILIDAKVGLKVIFDFYVLLLFFSVLYCLYLYVYVHTYKE